MLPLNLPELEVSGLALVTAIDDCPPIAGGEGSVVTARFVTREVHVVASVDVLGADGTVETITGTIIHPVWSVDRQEWVPLAELAAGEGLCCDTESFGLGFPSSLPPKASGLVLSISLSRVSQPVYDIEVHGEHVYQVGELGLLVHNVSSISGIADTISRSRNAALRAAKEANGIPRSAQPFRTIKPNTLKGIKLGLDDRNVVLYEYLNSAGQKIHIRLDKPASFGGPGGVGNQGWHFNAGPAFEKLKQHHFFGN